MHCGKGEEHGSVPPQRVANFNTSTTALQCPQLLYNMKYRSSNSTNCVHLISQWQPHCSQKHNYPGYPNTHHGLTNLENIFCLMFCFYKVKGCLKSGLCGYMSKSYFELIFLKVEWSGLVASMTPRGSQQHSLKKELKMHIHPNSQPISYSSLGHVWQIMSKHIVILKAEQVRWHSSSLPTQVFSLAPKYVSLTLLPFQKYSQNL